MEPLPEPWVKIEVEGKSIDFLVDMGAQFSSLLKPIGKLSGEEVWVQGANSTERQKWTTERTLNLASGVVKHRFLVLPNALCNLMGRDLLHKLWADIQFSEGDMTVTLGQPTVQVLVAAVDEYLLYKPVSKPEKIREGSLLQTIQVKFPKVWAEGRPPGLAKGQPPVVVRLKATATAV